VELAPFATGIDTWGHIRQEPLVVLATDELLAQLVRVDAGQERP